MAGKIWRARNGGRFDGAGSEVSRLRRRLPGDRARAVSDEELQPRLYLDHELTFSELNGDLLRWHQALQPFGSGNLQPLFFAREVEPAVAPQVLKEKHLVLRLRQKDHFRRAIFFDGALLPLPSTPWDMAFRLNADEYEGETRLQIQVEALRASAPIE